MRLSDRHELSVPETLAVSAALTLATLPFANPELDSSQAMQIAESTRPSIELDVQAAIPPVVGRIVVHSTVEKATEGGVRHQYIDVEPTTVSVLRPWARRFSEDPKATEQPGPSELAPVLSAVNKLTEDKAIRIAGLTAQGKASDEDDTVLRRGGINPGLGIKNKENVELADTRAETAGPVAQKAVEAIVDYKVPLNYRPGREVVDPALADRIFAEAEELNVTPNELVITFLHKPKTLPEGTQSVLGKLVQDRGVDFTIHAVRKIVAPETEVNDVKFVPIGAPIVRTHSEQSAVVEAVMPATTKVGQPNFAPVVVKAAQYTPQVARRQVQPRNYNFSNNPSGRSVSGKRGRMGRSSGGNRSMKRG